MPEYYRQRLPISAGRLALVQRELEFKITGRRIACPTKALPTNAGLARLCGITDWSKIGILAACQPVEQEPLHIRSRGHMLRFGVKIGQLVRIFGEVI